MKDFIKKIIETRESIKERMEINFPPTNTFDKLKEDILEALLSLNQAWGKRVREETDVEWETSKDELYTIFGECLSCGKKSVAMGSNFCSECGRKISAKKLLKN